MPTEAQTIQWYPGHMARAMRRLAEDMRLIDLVIEITDARLPGSGRNPALAHIAGKTRRLVVLGREDLANPQSTERWLAYFQARGEQAVALDAKSPASFTRLRKALAEVAGSARSGRVLVLGIPNAGKSTVINGLVGRSVARTADKAGVTRAAQWFRVRATHGRAADPADGWLEVMDTAGILVPKIDTPQAQWKLAMLGAVPRSHFDPEDVVTQFSAWAHENGLRKVPNLDAFAIERGFVRHGQAVDTHNAAWAFLKDFSEKRFGRVTLEEPPV
ncbi:MAG TPA: YlqF/YawG family GTPase [Candidatus Baltobacteraceae bacterium]